MHHTHQAIHPQLPCLKSPTRRMLHSILAVACLTMLQTLAANARGTEEQYYAAGSHAVPMPGHLIHHR